MSFPCHLSACFWLETYGGKMSVVLDNGEQNTAHFLKELTVF